MSKIYLDVEVPGNAKKYEFTADSAMSVGKVKNQIINQIATVENREIFPNKEAVLFCSVDLQGLLQDSEILADVGIKSGGRIILL